MGFQCGVLTLMHPIMIEDEYDQDEIDLGDAEIARYSLIVICEQALDYLSAEECRLILEGSIEMFGKARN